MLATALHSPGFLAYKLVEDSPAPSLTRGARLTDKHSHIWVLLLILFVFDLLLHLSVGPVLELPSAGIKRHAPPPPS